MMGAVFLIGDTASFKLKRRVGARRRLELHRLHQQGGVPTDDCVEEWSAITT